MTFVRSPAGSEAQLTALVQLFYSELNQLGRFQRVPSRELPPAYRRLLDHEQHMTVTVESFYGQPVDVRVLGFGQDQRHYWRRILLTRQSDRHVVQFGIVRLDRTCLQPEVRSAVESRRVPLGRILIEHNVMRDVELLTLWRVEMGSALRALMPARSSDRTYGRTARIHCNGEPAVELLEIVAPVPQAKGPSA